MAATKFVVGVAIGSLALISEALHSSVDLVATVITWLVVRVSDQPADEEHHYGHGKIESLSALGVIAMLYVLAGGIVVQAWSHLRDGAPPPTLSAVPFVVLLVDIAVNFWRARALHRTALDTRSQALEADALHFASDVFGSSRGHHRACAVGPRLCMGRRRRGDRRLPILISLLGLRLGRSTIETLLDRAPEGAGAKADRGDQGGARRDRCRTLAGADGRVDAFHRRHRAGAAHLSHRPHRGDQAPGAGRRHQRARRRRPDIHRGTGRARQ